MNIRRVSDRWIAAGKETIDTVFGALGTAPLGGFSNLIPLLSGGIDFVKKNGNNGSLLLLSSADQHGEYQTANQILPGIMALMNPTLRIDVADFATSERALLLFQQPFLQGKRVSVFNLTRMTGGESRSLRVGGRWLRFSRNRSRRLEGTFSSFDLTPSVQGGFCHSRYGGIAKQWATIYQPSDICRSDQYQGAFPFIDPGSGDVPEHPLCPNRHGS